MGVGRFLRERQSAVRVHPLEPAESPTLSTGHKVGQHRIQGISDEFIPPIVDSTSSTTIIAVHDGDAILMAQKLARISVWRSAFRRARTSSARWTVQNAWARRRRRDRVPGQQQEIPEHRSAAPGAGPRRLSLARYHNRRVPRASACLRVVRRPAARRGNTADAAVIIAPRQQRRLGPHARRS